MRTHLAIYFTILLLILPELYAQDVERSGNGFRATIKENFQTSSATRLVIRDLSGDVEITSWEQNSIEVVEQIFMRVYTEEEARTIVRNSRNNYEATGRSIQISGDGGWSQHRRDLIIKVPKNFDINARISQGDLLVKHVKGNISLSTSNGELVLGDLKGELDVSTSAGDIEMENIDARVHATTSAGDVILNNLIQEAYIQTSGGDIELEGAGADVTLRTSGGYIRATQVSGNLTVQTSGGDIDILHCKGNVEAQTSGGDIVLDNIRGSVSAQTSGGDIDGSQLAVLVMVQTNGGDIDLQDIKGAVEAQTSAGSITLVVTLTDFSADHHIHLNTSSGDIDLSIPEKMPASITATIDNVDERWHTYSIYSDFPLSRESKGQRRIRMSGDINGGGDAIILETGAGDIEINKTRK